MSRGRPRTTLFPYTTLFRSRTARGKVKEVKDTGDMQRGRVDDRARIFRNCLHARRAGDRRGDRKSTRLNSSHTVISYAVFCLKKKIRRRSAPPRTRDRCVEE